MIFGSGFVSVCASLDNFTAFSNIFIPPCYAEFSFQGNSQASEANYLSSSGVIQTREAGITQERYILTLTIQETDFSTLQIAMGELSLFTENIETTTVELITLNSTVYTDTRILSSIESGILAFNTSTGNIMKKVTVPPENNNEYQVISASNEINFFSSQIGQTISIKIPVPGQTLGCIGGGTTFAEFCKYSFSGAFFTTTMDGPYTLQISDLRRINSPTLVSTGGSTVIQIEFQAVMGNNEENERKPFRLYSPTSGVSLNEFVIFNEDGFGSFFLQETGERVKTEDSP